MVRNYKRKTSVVRMTYTKEDIKNALKSVSEGMTLRAAACHFKIPKTTLQQYKRGRKKEPGNVGRKTALLQEEEEFLAQNIVAMGMSGLAFSVDCLRKFIQDHLTKHNRNVPYFKANLPGRDWAYNFLERHCQLTQHICHNISRKRIVVSEKEVSDFFNHRLKHSLDCVPPSNIINYNETHVTDDPIGKLTVFRKGANYAERIISMSESSTSLMFACTATGDVLDPYVVYKGECLHETWVSEGPANGHYNQTNTGWFDPIVFIDWLKKVVITYCNKRLPKNEPKLIIGDNLSSYMSIEVMQLAKENNIRMVFLPPNSSGILQPLDVGLFGPMKEVWQEALTDWQLGEGMNMATLPKEAIPKLLLASMLGLETKWRDLILAGFKESGIHPWNPQSVLEKL